MSWHNVTIYTRSVRLNKADLVEFPQKKTDFTFEQMPQSFTIWKSIFLSNMASIFYAANKPNQHGLIA